MNARQMKAMWVGTAVMGILVLFPPHVMIPNAVELVGTQVGLPGAKPFQLTRYAFLFTPPAGSAGIDWQRLLLPIGFVGVMTTAAVLSLKTRTEQGPSTI